MLSLQRRLTPTLRLKNYPILVLSWHVSLVDNVFFPSVFLVENELHESRTLSCSPL